MERTRVQVGPCRCPGKPHAEDWVELHESIPVALGAGFRAALRASGGNEVRLQGLLAKVYLEHGIRAWSFQDEDGRGITVDDGAFDWPDTVARLLPWDKGGATVADQADALYSEDILRPLTGRSLTQLRAGQTGGSTSPTQPSSPIAPRPSRRSSRTTSAAGKQSDA